MFSPYNNVIYHINNLYISKSFKIYIVPSIKMQMEDLIFSGVSSIGNSLIKKFSWQRFSEAP